MKLFSFYSMIPLFLALFSSFSHAAYDPNAINQLTTDVTALGNTSGVSAATVVQVGGSTALSVHNAAVAVAAAASTNTPSTLVLRDSSGNFAAGSITAALLGNASTSTAFATTPTACSANQFATSQAANGNFSCAQPSAAALSGVLPVGSGGTGDSTLTANNLLVGAGTGSVTFIAPGTSGNVLTSNGTTWSSAAPTPANMWGAPSCTVTISASATVATSTCVLLVNASGGAVTVTLPAAASALQAVSIKKIDASANTVTITPPTGTLDGAANYVETLQNDAALITSDSTNYWIQ